jgi:hypothetical protein
MYVYLFLSQIFSGRPFSEDAISYLAISLILFSFQLRHHDLVLQWETLNGIVDNGFNWLMGSNLSKLTSPEFSFMPNVFNSHSINLISQLLESVYLCPRGTSVSF